MKVTFLGVCGHGGGVGGMQRDLRVKVCETENLRNRLYISI